MNWTASSRDRLYGGDSDYRLRQEAVLGIGGTLILEAMGYRPAVYHMNEGHAALLTVALMDLQLAGGRLTNITDQDVAAIRQHCVFTTHTPVPAGHDRFSRSRRGAFWATIAQGARAAWLLSTRGS